jgi:hypothetical protein
MFSMKGTSINGIIVLFDGSLALNEEVNNIRLRH